MEASKAAVFRQVRGNSGATLFVMHRRADHPTSMKLLEEAKLRPLTYQEALFILTKDEKLREPFKGQWFRPAAGEGIKKTAVCMIYGKSQLVKLNGAVSPEIKVRLSKGIMPLSISVATDATLFNDWRYDVGAYLPPDIEAPLVVGVPKDLKNLIEARSQPGLRRNSGP
jgi:hypothetical protein